MTFRKVETLAQNLQATGGGDKIQSETLQNLKSMEGRHSARSTPDQSPPIIGCPRPLGWGLSHTASLKLHKLLV